VGSNKRKENVGTNSRFGKRLKTPDENAKKGGAKKEAEPNLRKNQKEKKVKSFSSGTGCFLNGLSKPK